MRSLLLAVLVLFCLCAKPSAAITEKTFEDPLFRRCIIWMMDGYRGAFLQVPCMDEYDLPQPSLFLCARKIRQGFADATDREACALIFEEEAKAVRAGYIK